MPGEREERTQPGSGSSRYRSFAVGVAAGTDWTPEPCCLLMGKRKVRGVSFVCIHSPFPTIGLAGMATTTWVGD